MSKTADQKFWDLRNSGYTGPIDQDGNIPPADDRLADTCQALHDAT